VAKALQACGHALVGCLALPVLDRRAESLRRFGVLSGQRQGVAQAVVQSGPGRGVRGARRQFAQDVRRLLGLPGHQQGVGIQFAGRWGRLGRIRAARVFNGALRLLEPDGVVRQGPQHIGIFRGFLERVLQEPGRPGQVPKIHEALGPGQKQVQLLLGRFGLGVGALKKADGLGHPFEVQERLGAQRRNDDPVRLTGDLVQKFEHLGILPLALADGGQPQQGLAQSVRVGSGVPDQQGVVRGGLVVASHARQQVCPDKPQPDVPFVGVQDCPGLAQGVVQTAFVRQDDDQHLLGVEVARYECEVELKLLDGLGALALREQAVGPVQVRKGLHTQEFALEPVSLERFHVRGRGNLGGRLRGRSGHVDEQERAEEGGGSGA